MRPFAAMSVAEVAALTGLPTDAGGARDERGSTTSRSCVEGRPSGTPTWTRGSTARRAAAVCASRTGGASTTSPARPTRGRPSARWCYGWPGASRATSSASATPPTTSRCCSRSTAPIVDAAPRRRASTRCSPRVSAGRSARPAPGPAGWTAAVLAVLAGERAAAGGGVSGVPLDPRVAERVSEIGTAELVVGIPSFNNARTIGHVVRAVAAGLAKYFPGRRAVIVNSDGGSRDGTAGGRGRARTSARPRPSWSRTRVDPVHKIVTPYHGLPGQGQRASGRSSRSPSGSGARACAVVDSDLRSITPEWIELLLGPVVEHGFDYVAPLYLRHKYDGTITNSIVYPLTRALYGREVRQPIGGDFGFSGRLASHYLAPPGLGDRRGPLRDRHLDDDDRARRRLPRVPVVPRAPRSTTPRTRAPTSPRCSCRSCPSVFDLMETYHERWASGAGGGGGAALRLPARGRARAGERRT